MLLGHQQLLLAVETAVASACSAAEACRSTVTALSHGTDPRPLQPPERISVLLSIHDRLRTVAATGSWQTFATVPAGSGIAGRVWSAGQPVVVPVVQEDPDYIALRPDVRSEICVPVLEPGGRPIGVLDLEWTGPVELAPWHRTAEAVAELLGRRIAELGGPPPETRGEQLLRHVAAMTTATTEWELRVTTLTAAREVSGLAAGILLLPGSDGHRPVRADSQPGGELAERIVAALSAAPPADVERLVERAHRLGAAYTLGEPDRPPTLDTKALTTIGIGTLITVPLGQPETGGVLLAADQRVVRPEPSMVNLLELLAAQAWACLDRLRGLARLRERASSDPLTGLRHHGPFGERMAAATPGRTALLAIDVDGFKNVNDTYGHQAGDQVLIGLARALEGALRQGDELYRIGGDEFVAVVEVSRPEEALGIGERLAEAARRLDRTISVGVAVRRHREPPEDTMRRADAALYDVKRRGRDGVRLAPA